MGRHAGEAGRSVVRTARAAPPDGVVYAAPARECRASRRDRMAADRPCTKLAGSTGHLASGTDDDGADYGAGAESDGCRSRSRAGGTGTAATVFHPGGIRPAVGVSEHSVRCRAAEIPAHAPAEFRR